MVEYFFIWRYFESEPHETRRRLQQVAEAAVDQIEAVKGLVVSGYESNDMIDNLESLYVVMLISIVILLLLPICCVIPFRFFRRLSKYWSEVFFWDGLIRFMLESQLEIAVGSLITLNFYSQSTFEEMSYKACISYLVSIFFVTAFVTLPFFFAHYVNHNRKQIIFLRYVETEDYKKHMDKYGSMHDGLDLRKHASSYSIFLFMSRRLVVALSLVFMSDKPTFQLMTF